MNLLVPMFLYIGGVIVMSKIVIPFISQTVKIFAKTISSSSTQLIGEGSEKKSKVKFLDKEPVTNPEVANQNNTNNNYMQGGANRLPDMRGVGYDMAGGTMPQAGGGGISGMIGLVNMVGLSNQTGNISNNLIAGAQMVGGVNQQGNVIANKTFRGSRVINQSAVSSMNEYRGRRTMINQNGKSTNTFTGKTSISTGESTNNIYGPVSRVRSGSGDVRTEKMSIEGASKINSLNAKTLYAPKVKRMKIQELNSQGGNSDHKGLNSRLRDRRYVKEQIGELEEEYGVRIPNRKIKNPNITVNNIILKDENGKLKRFTLNKNTKSYEKFVQNVVKEAGIQDVESSGQIPTVEVTSSSQTETTPNGNTNVPEASTDQASMANQSINYAAMLEMMNMMSMNQSQPQRVTEKNVYNNSEVRQMAIRMMPEQNVGTINKATDLTNELAKERARKNWMRANSSANRKFNVGERNRSDLDDMLKDASGTARMHFDRFVEETWGDEIHKEPSKEEMKAIEAQAIENVNRREGIPLEKKQKEYDEQYGEEKERLLKEREGEQRMFFEENAKALIFQDPKSAEIILGKEAAEELRNQMTSNEKARDTEAIKEIVKQEFEEQQKFLKKHKEYAGRSYDEIYRARRQEMMQNDLQTAVNQINANAQGQENNAEANNVMVHPNTQIYMTNQARSVTPENEDVG